MRLGADMCIPIFSQGSPKTEYAAADPVNTTLKYKMQLYVSGTDFGGNLKTWSERNTGKHFLDSIPVMDELYTYKFLLNLRCAREICTCPFFSNLNDFKMHGSILY